MYAAALCPTAIAHMLLRCFSYESIVSEKRCLSGVAAKEYHEGEKQLEANIMELSKTRRQGNSIIIPIPAALGVAEGEEFYLRRSDNGVLLLIPKIPDYFADVKEGAFRQPLEWGNIYTPMGREEVE